MSERKRFVKLRRTSGGWFYLNPDVVASIIPSVAKSCRVFTIDEPEGCYEVDCDMYRCVYLLENPGAEW